MNDVFIRPLEINDAYTSVNWRNNCDIWKLTAGKPDKTVSIEMELEWIHKAVNSTSEKRFAICLEHNKQYIGNAQLTHITSNDAQFHIFIGETVYWNKGLGQKAATQTIQYGFDQMGLNEIYLLVNNKHNAAIKSYLNSGFTITGFEKNTKQVKMSITKTS